MSERKVYVVGLDEAVASLKDEAGTSMLSISAMCGVSAPTLIRWMDVNEYSPIMREGKQHQAIGVQRQVLARFIRAYTTQLGRPPSIRTLP